MNTEELKNFIRGRKTDEFVDTEVLNRRPWIFATDAQHDQWCRSVAEALNVDPADIRIVGSAATGYSLSPYKAGRPFRNLAERGRTSDIDLAITSDDLFEDAWNTIVTRDRGRTLSMTGDQRDKMRTDVYWGLVAQKSLPGNTDSARRLLTALARATVVPPIRGYLVRCRIYRRREDLKAYHVASLRQLRLDLNV
jgi:hypothetical protein